MMKTIAAAVLLIAAVPAACGKHEPGTTTMTEPESGAPSKTIATFKKFTADSRMADVKRMAGPSDGDVGSGIHIYVWKLEDGSQARVGTPDNDLIFYIDWKHPDGSTERILGHATRR